MSAGMFCPKCCKTSDAGKGLWQCQREGCPMPVRRTAQELFFHAMPKPDACEHDFKGWREFSDGNGGETVCTKCGMGAMAYSLSTGA